MRVFGDGAEIGQQRLEAVHGQALLGASGRCRLARYFGRCDDRGALSIGARLIVIVKEQRGKRLAHVPLDIIGQHTEENMRADTIG